MSAYIASSIPQPTAAPLTAAITGMSVCRSASAAGVSRGSREPEIRRLLAAAHDLLHVVAGTERRVGAGDHEASGRRFAHRGFERGVGRPGQRVARLGPVDRDHPHVTVRLVDQLVVLPWSDPQSSWWQCRSRSRRSIDPGRPTRPIGAVVSRSRGRVGRMPSATCRSWRVHAGSDQASFRWRLGVRPLDLRDWIELGRRRRRGDRRQGSGSTPSTRRRCSPRSTDVERGGAAGGRRAARPPPRPLARSLRRRRPRPRAASARRGRPPRARGPRADGRARRPPRVRCGLGVLPEPLGPALEDRPDAGRRPRPVALLNEQLEAPIDRFFDRLTPERSFWRLGWGVLDTDDWYTPTDGTAAPRPAGTDARAAVPARRARDAAPVPGVERRAVHDPHLRDADPVGRRRRARSPCASPMRSPAFPSRSGRTRTSSRSHRRWSIASSDRPRQDAKLDTTVTQLYVNDVTHNPGPGARDVRGR